LWAGLRNVVFVDNAVPLGKGRRFGIHKTALDRIAGGWGIDLIDSEYSGLPLNITYNPNRHQTVSPLISMYPNLTGQSVYASAVIL
jgi:hypothetical protein